MLVIDILTSLFAIACFGVVGITVMNTELYYLMVLPIFGFGLIMYTVWHKKEIN